MSDGPRTPRQLAELVLGSAAVRELEARGLEAKLQIDGDFEDVEELAAALDSKRAHQARLATMGELGAGVVHEVRNWVGSIQGFTDLARRGEVAPEVSHLLERIRELTGRCSDSLAAFLGLVSGANEPIGAFEVAPALKRAAVLARHQLEVHNVRLELNSGDHEPVAIGRANELTQVLVNLALNAQQSMTGPGRVEISTRTANGHVYIDVADDGPGVPVELRERIFQPFYTTKSSDRGTGLGLSISARLVEQWDGQLQVGDSDLGGALFTIQLRAVGG